MPTAVPILWINGGASEDRGTFRILTVYAGGSLGEVAIDLPNDSLVWRVLDHRD